MKWIQRCNGARKQKTFLFHFGNTKGFISISNDTLVIRSKFQTANKKIREEGARISINEAILQRAVII